ncbi:MAG TPA: hypothetical protein VME46_18945, partial [Acidimicrobiales bacterium]|nr:hypothetical protein [Acidimicrobiales bacterium]
MRTTPRPTPPDGPTPPGKDDRTGVVGGVALAEDHPGNKPATKPRAWARAVWERPTSVLPAGTAQVALVALAATLLAWPGWTAIKVGLDPSWQAGIAEGFVRHLQWGRSLDFTYGPYGFAARIKAFYRSTALISFLYALTGTWLLATLIVAGLRRSWGLAVSGLVAWAVLTMSDAADHVADYVAVVGLGLSLVLLRAPDLKVRSTIAICAGALASFSFLVKLNTGIVVAALLALGVVGSDGRWRERGRLAGLAATTMLAVFVVAWLAAAQSISNIPSFLANSVGLVLGYSTAMGGRLSPHTGTVPLWALAVMVIIAATAWNGLHRWPRRGRTFGALIVTAWAWATVKEGFVSGNHFPEFFLLTLGGVAMTCLTHPPKRLFAGALGIAACMTLQISGLPVTMNPIGSVRSFASQALDLAIGGRFARLAAASRARIIAAEPLSPRTLALMKGHTVAIEPWENIAAWADPNSIWDPEPVVQSYSAYTTRLDHLDAAFMASPAAPQRVLFYRFRDGFDTRDFFMDPPSTSVEIYCHYAQLAVSGPWQVLERVPDRCGPAEVIGHTQVRFGELISVPRAGRGCMVFATFSLGLSPLAELEDLLLRPPFTYLTVWYVQGRPITYRFVTGTASDDHVLATPPALGYAARYTPGTLLRLEFSGAGWRPGQGAIIVTFFA